MSDLHQTSDSGLRDFALSEFQADAELCTVIEKWSPPTFVKEGEILFRQGDAPGYAFFVKSGEIALTMYVSGDALWKVLATKGSLVGLLAIIGNEPYSMTAKSLETLRFAKSPAMISTS